MLLTSSPWLHERSWTSVQEYLKHDDLILVPIGATEQHGRHTPLMVDTGWAIAVAEGAALATGTLVAPPQHVGWSPHHLAYCGALTFRPETLISVMVDIGESLIHHGFRKIVFVNGNRIANLPPMEIAAAKLRFSTGAYVSVVDAGLIARREVGEICQAGENGHGGDSETSFMLHWRYGPGGHVAGRSGQAASDGRIVPDQSHALSAAVRPERDLGAHHRRGNAAGA
ncbi:creatininase family protein [Achromobacter xylosoxidans]